MFYRIGTTDLPDVTNAATEIVMRHSIPNMPAKAEAVDNFANSNVQPRINGRLREYLQRVARAESVKHRELDHSDVVQQTLLEAHLTEMKGNAPQHLFEQRKIPEIADAIGRSDRAVAGMLFRSLQTLKEDLIECSDGPNWTAPRSALIPIVRSYDHIV